MSELGIIHLRSLALKGNEGSGEEETPLAEETVSLRGVFCFIGSAENLHGG
jgi:hypothetical protein